MCVCVCVSASGDACPAFISTCSVESPVLSTAGRGKHLVKSIALLPPPRFALDYSLHFHVAAGSARSCLSQTSEMLVAHVVDGCEVCEARATRTCDSCETGDPVFVFQASSLEMKPTIEGRDLRKEDVYVCSSCSTRRIFA